MTLELKTISAAAPKALLVPSAAEAFERLRKETVNKSGRDFLSRLADCYRPPDFRSSKTGVANRSWHKAGRAFDYDQTATYLVIVKELIRGAVFFRTWIRCAKQDGSQGEFVTACDYRGFQVSGWLFDFTRTAERLGWARIPAWHGWQRHYNYREFWHYQFTEGLTLAEALSPEQRPSTTTPKHSILRRGDRGPHVRQLQELLYSHGLVSSNEIDGRFGDNTREAVIAFQRRHGLEPDGIAGPATFEKLYAFHR
jgi:hypothetical protein